MTVERPFGPGGLERLLSSVAGRAGARWLFSGTSDADREIARAFPYALPRAPRLRMLSLPPELQRGHYEVIGGLVADVFHYDVDSTPLIPDSTSLRVAWRSYLRVNNVYARAVATTPDAVTLVQDHQLLLVAGALRCATTRAGERPLHYFHHIPWCEPEYFGLFPEPIGINLLLGALAHDTVGFHTKRWATAFIRCCERFLPGASCAEDAVSLGARRVAVRAIPGTIDTGEVLRAAHMPAVARRMKRLRADSRGRSTLVRVDRWTPAKNALRGFLAVEALLARRPDLAPRLWFLAVLTVPHRASAAIRSYHDACRSVVRRVNELYRTGAPAGADIITLLVNDDPGRCNRNDVLAAMRSADTVLVNSVFDGMNLVAKEACVAADRDPVLVLSRNAGAAEALGGAALLVDPFDVLDTAKALERAISMPAGERQCRARQLRAAADSGPVMSWLRDQTDVLPPARGLSRPVLNRAGYSQAVA